MKTRKTGVDALARAAKEASRALAVAPTAVKNRALRAMARALRRRAGRVLAANRVEVAAAKAAGRSAAFVDRLSLDRGRLDGVARALERVAALPDPVGRTTPFSRRPNGLLLRRMRVPLGVVLIVYESRPGVTADAAGLCLKAGDAALLRGGKEAVRTNAEIAAALRAGLRAAGLPPGAVGFVADPDRAAVRRLLELDALIDLVIPRGGPELTRAVRRDSAIPVLSHDRGVCHVYVDAGADLRMAERIALNAKAERPGVCNAMETLLVHRGAARAFLPRLARAMAAAGVELRGDARARRIVPSMRPAADADWDAEYLDLILSVKVVRSLGDALDHIARHGTGLAEAIVTRDRRRAARFLREADAGAVYVNASTRFTDGGEFGLGAEMGISTQKIHARGPVGLEGLTCEKFVVRGRGQVRDSRR
ncbi:MAG: glutamate-5-semialdehyde dehydrogenase [Elusimicrobia bacterium]|nr:glutamate-5-semialdehyde dehydrogenase [Elusimicrobiota bacterium]